MSRNDRSFLLLVVGGSRWNDPREYQWKRSYVGRLYFTGRALMTWRAVDHQASYCPSPEWQIVSFACAMLVE